VSKSSEPPSRRSRLSASVRSLHLLRLLLFLFVGLMALRLAGCTDPRSHCTHPKHYEWAKEQEAKRLRKQGLK